MNRNRYGRSVVVFVTVFCLLTAVAYGQRAAIKKVKWAREFVFKGVVENVDPNAQSVTVRSENIPGWLNSVSRYGMTLVNIRMTYKVDNPEVLKTLKPGDRVSATVLEGDFEVLYDLRVAPPEDTPVFFPKK